ncbi:SirB2 family protein [Gallaecimonas sp. GXIMD4217]|uniref:SirB2 family protein n=1 Tax=Gallaecimonas sp. GXIMD4217 TaxID=3131927 RepID=UPI00311AC8CB
MSYLAIKHLHQSLAFLSLALFIWRAIRAIPDPGRIPKWARVAPHIIDTGLLLAGLYLMMLLHQYPFVHHWLTAKVLALLLYIALGTLAIKRAPTPGLRAASALGAVLTFAYMVGVAISKSPLSWLNWL